MHMRRRHYHNPESISVTLTSSDANRLGVIQHNRARQQGQQSNSQTHPELLKALPPKEELQRVFVESSRKENEK